MGSKEQSFSDNLDLALRGQSFGVASAEEAELLAFARKMASLRPSPSPEFTLRLKSKLLQQLAAREEIKRARHGWLWRFFSRPIYQVALAALTLAIVGGALYASGLFNSPSTTAPVQPTVLAVAASTNKTSYQAGEPVFIQVSLTNITAETLNFAQFPPILSLMRAADKQPVYTFGAGSETLSLAPSATTTFDLVWRQQDARGQAVGDGRYYIELEDLYYNGTTVKLAPAQPVSFTIS